MVDSPSIFMVLLILYRGAGLTVVWRDLAAMAVLGAAFFFGALRRFRRTLAA